METESIQDIVEKALEQAIESLDIVATDETLDRHLKETQDMCNRALIELRGYGHELPTEDWNNN